MPDKALLFELEYVGMQGRRAVFDTAAAALAEHGLDVQTWMMPKYGINVPIERWLDRVIEQAGPGRNIPDDLVSRTKARITACLVEPPPVPDGFPALLEASRSAGFALGALTCLPLETARAVAGAVGMRESDTIYACGCHRDGHCLSADGWLKLMRDMRVKPALGIALTSSSAGCKAAVQAGLSCIVIPDAFTAFADFGGCDLIVDSVADLSVDRLLALTRTA